MTKTSEKEAIVVTVKAIPSLFEELVAATQAMMPETRAFPGCIEAHLLLAPEREEMVIFQIWESSEAQSAYLTWRAERGDFERLGELIHDEQIFRTYSLG
ncbi:putative quinol monooxygenase [Phaeobacter sp. S60]|uniref:putative quinol monooxygenase n=1 Tax=Phaeobacter sp. S60 TaxID=1569353 RepID=UPI000694EC45|nr:antibiotic biosynthesis monooxygenase [Phaeobacter sp. S60]